MDKGRMYRDYWRKPRANTNIKHIHTYTAQNGDMILIFERERWITLCHYKLRVGILKFTLIFRLKLMDYTGVCCVYVWVRDDSMATLAFQLYLNFHQVHSLILHMTHVLRNTVQQPDGGGNVCFNVTILRILIWFQRFELKRQYV